MPDRDREARDTIRDLSKKVSDMELLLRDVWPKDSDGTWVEGTVGMDGVCRLCLVDRAYMDHTEGCPVRTVIFPLAGVGQGGANEL